MYKSVRTVLLGGVGGSEGGRGRGVSGLEGRVVGLGGSGILAVLLLPPFSATLAEGLFETAQWPRRG